MGSHLFEFVDIGVGVDKAEAGSDRVVDKQQVGEFVPGSIVASQSAVFIDTIRTDFHQCAVLRTAAWSTIQP